MSLIRHKKVKFSWQSLVRCEAFTTLRGENHIQARSFGLDADLSSGRCQLSSDKPNPSTLCDAPRGWVQSGPQPAPNKDLRGNVESLRRPATPRS